MPTARPPVRVEHRVGNKRVCKIFMKCGLEVPHTKFVKIRSVTYFSDRRK